MDATEEQFLAHLKETNPHHWAGYILSELRDYLSKRTDCTGLLGLEKPEKRYQAAEALSIALEKFYGGMIFGISDGDESVTANYDPEKERYQVLAEIERHITPDTACLLVNVIRREEIRQPSETPGEQVQTP